MYPKDCYGETINGRPNALYNWCCSQRRNKAKLSPKHLFQLEQINFPWDSEEKQKSDKWDNYYEQLVLTKKIHKENWLDSYLDDDKNPLKEWIDTQRKNKNKLHKDKLERLIAINFNWNSPEEDIIIEWNKNFNAYKKYINKYKTEDNKLPRTRKDSALDKWCTFQRNHKNSLTDVQINLLNTFGFEWRHWEEIKEEEWNLNYNEIKEYLENNSFTLPPESCEDVKLKHLKYWFKYQLNNKAKLSEEQIEKIEALDRRKRKKTKVQELELEF